MYWFTADYKLTHANVLRSWRNMIIVSKFVLWVSFSYSHVFVIKCKYCSKNFASQYLTSAIFIYLQHRAEGTWENVIYQENINLV